MQAVNRAAARVPPVLPPTVSAMVSTMAVTRAAVLVPPTLPAAVSANARNRHGLCCDQAMAAVGIPVIDSHSPSIARPDKTLDGYHYFDRHTEDLDAAGVEVCIGNSVARTLANLILNAVASL
eukprot:3128795-Rhodomonas_salina.1